jgi:hypothetical protein
LTLPKLAELYDGYGFNLPESAEPMFHRTISPSLYAACAVLPR